MGLLDVLTGMRNGPGGQPSQSTSSGGMSPITMAILALLAYKGIKHLGGSNQQQPVPAGNPQRLPGTNPMNTNVQNGGGGLGDLLGGLLGGRSAAPGAGVGPSGGGLGDILGGLLGGRGAAPGAGAGALGGLLEGGAAGSILSGGLGGLLNQFQQNGQGDKAETWVAKGPNKSVSAAELEQALGPDRIAWLMRETGLSREELLAGLGHELPGAIDQLTPEGRIPTAQEADRLLQQQPARA